MTETRHTARKTVVSTYRAGAAWHHVMGSTGHETMDARSLHDRVVELALRTGSRVVHEVLFGADGAFEGRPLTRVGDVAAYPADAGAVHATLVPNGDGEVDVHPGIGQAAVARWQSGAADFCVLSNVQADNPHGSVESQARQVFDRIEADLQAVGMTTRSAVRTWFYLDGILDWHDTFNRVRTEVYRRRGVLDGCVPASTAVGVALSSGKALVADVFAVRPADSRVTVSAVASPVRHSAEKDGRPFTRAVEIAAPGWRTLLVAGTVSVGANGRTVHPDDASAQIERTLDAVGAILASRRMGWNDATRSVAYFADLGDRSLWDRYRDRKGLCFPAAVTQCEIHRKGLRFEIEVDATIEERKEGER